MRTFIFAVLVFPAVLFLFPALPAAGDDAYPRSPGARERRERDLVREPDLRISETVTVPGFWRPRRRPGYRWIEASPDEAGRWHSGYWEPLGLENRREKVILPGYWGPAWRYGYIWIKTAEGPDRYQAGSWKLMNSFELVETPREWVPGYWNRRRWVPGYWRDPRREGYTWVEGYYRPDGLRQEARWVKSPDGV